MRVNILTGERESMKRKFKGFKGSKISDEEGSGIGH